MQHYPYLTMEEKWDTGTGFTDFVVSLVFQKFLAIQFEPSFLLSRKKHTCVQTWEFFKSFV